MIAIRRALTFMSKNVTVCACQTAQAEAAARSPALGIHSKAERGLQREKL